jgi:probable rRNA maturation factor
VSVVRVALAVSRERVARLARRVLAAERRGSGHGGGALSIVFIGPAAMRRLNREWKGHDEPTDVLSFALPGPSGGLAGEVYICPAVARAQARAFGAGAGEELLRLVIHGTLHLLGYDHPMGPSRTRSAMWRRQERYLARLA